jgi:predicted NBD/HSP70 family sugar kinase
LSAWLGVDLGGTKLRFEDFTVTLEDRRVDSVVERVAQVAIERQAEGVAIAVAGWLSVDGARVIQAPNLGWGPTDLAAAFAARGLACHLENDLDARAFGEWLALDLESRGDLLAVNAGTGFALGMVVNGALLRGARRRAGELGHWRPGGIDGVCGCGQRGCLEAAVGGAGLGRDDLLNPQLAEVWCAHVVACLAPVLTALDPRHVVAVGGIFDARPDLRRRIAELLDERLPSGWAVPFQWGESASGEAAARRGVIALAGVARAGN